jgi:hypothetical protein
LSLRVRVSGFLLLVPVCPQDPSIGVDPNPEITPIFAFAGRHEDLDGAVSGDLQDLALSDTAEVEDIVLGVVADAFRNQIALRQLKRDFRTPFLIDDYRGLRGGFMGTTETQGYKND